MLTASIIGVSLLSNGKIKISFKAYQILFALFVVFTAFSTLWAIDSSRASSQFFTMVLIFICSTVVSWHFSLKKDVFSLIDAVKWAGYIVSIYSIFFYGFDYLLEATNSARLDNEFSNVNSIGLLAALACVFQVHQILYKRNRIISLILCIPAIMVVAATQSRKALLFLVVGVIGVIILKSLNRRLGVKTVIVAFAAVSASVVLIYLISKISIFDGIIERMDGLIASITGSGTVDSSTETRNKMVKVGFETFLDHPLLGIGIGNSYVITLEEFSRSTYLHNNYIELLCCGGIVGMLCYYSLHAYIIYNLIKYRKNDKEAFAIGILWMFLMLVMDWGMVSYYSKIQAYYLLINFLNVEFLKAKGKKHVNS
jgi:O-antigen ligase